MKFRWNWSTQKVKRMLVLIFKGLQNLLYSNKEELLRNWKESIILHIYEKSGETDGSISLLYTKLLGIMSVDFNIVDFLLIGYSISITHK
jgi:hypothetical protein